VAWLWFLVYGMTILRVCSGWIVLPMDLVQQVQENGGKYKVNIQMLI